MTALYRARDFLMQSAVAPLSAYLLCARGAEDAVQAGREFAQRIFCETHTACGHCLACRKFCAGNQPDYLEITAADQIRIGEVRRIPEFLASASYGGGYRCIHIAYASRLTEQAQNYLLKMIEEPPAGVVFLLSLDNKQKILATIRSRCMEVALEPQPREEIAAMLQREGVPAEQAAYAAAWSGGSPAEARRIAADAELSDIRAHAEAIAVRLATKRRPSMFLMEQDFSAAGKRLGELLYALSSLFADAAVWPGGAALLANPDRQQTVALLAQRFTLRQIQRIMELLNQRAETKQRFPQFRDDLLQKSLIFDILEVMA